MTQRLVQAVAVAALLLTGATAQDNCPKTKAQTIDRSLVFEGSMDCGGISITVAGTQLTSPTHGCPLLAVETPAHEREVPQKDGLRTYAKVWDRVSVRTFHFECDQDWLLFLPWGSSCRFTRVTIGGVLPRMTTVPCAPIAP